MRARLLIIMAAFTATFACRAAAGPWSIEPRLGASASYDSNPGLGVDPKAEAHAAALFNLPLRYDGDDVQFGLTPYGRIGDSAGYSSLASNVLHLDATAQFMSELGSTALQGELARDSSLYHAGELVNGVGVRRDTSALLADWNRFVTERSQVILDLSWSRVLYDQPPDTSVLVDYRYYSLNPTFAYSLSERDTLKLLGSYGDYQSIDNLTASKSINFQLGYTRRLSELWTLSASAGASHANNTQKVFFGPFFLGDVQFSQSGAVYSLNLAHQGEHLNLSAGISRSLVPTGLAYLSRQDAINFTATYTYNERWTLVANAAVQEDQNPTAIGTLSTVHYLNAQLTANWQWTPRWVISMHAGRISQTLGSPPATVASSGVSVDIVRQFLRVPL